MSSRCVKSIQQKQKPVITTRFVNLDGLRGLSALSVCLFHFTNSPVSHLPENSSVCLVSWYGHLGVYVFFTLSAIVIPYSMYSQSYSVKQTGSFLVKRLLRLEPPYLFSMLIAVLLNYLVARSPSYTGWPFYTHTEAIGSNVTHLAGFLCHRWIVVVYWTLAIEWQFYLVVIVLYPLITSSNDYCFWLCLLIINTPIYFIDNESVWFTYASYFSIGFLAFRYLINRIDRVILLFCVLLIMIHISYMFSTDQAIAATLPILVLFMPPIRFYPLSFLATISYSLYLTHLLTGYNFLKISQQYATTPGSSLLLIVVALLVSIGFAYLTCRLIELPAQALARRIYQRGYMAIATKKTPD